MLGLYSLMLWLDFSIYTVIVIFGLLVAAIMEVVRRHHARNVRTGPLPVIPVSDAHAPRAGAGYLFDAPRAAQDKASSALKRPET